MRCIACNNPLGSRESTRKGLFSGEYIDLCDNCYGTIEDDAPSMDSPYHSGFVEVKEVNQERHDNGDTEESETNNSSER